MKFYAVSLKAVRHLCKVAFYSDTLNVFITLSNTLSLFNSLTMSHPFSFLSPHLFGSFSFPLIHSFCPSLCLSPLCWSLLAQWTQQAELRFFCVPKGVSEAEAAEWKSCSVESHCLKENHPFFWLSQKNDFHFRAEYKVHPMMPSESLPSLMWVFYFWLVLRLWSSVPEAKRPNHRERKCEWIKIWSFIPNSSFPSLISHHTPRGKFSPSFLVVMCEM